MRASNIAVYCFLGTLIAGCGSIAKSPKSSCTWEYNMYSTALNVIATDSANIADYFVNENHLRIAVWDTAFERRGIDYEELGFTPEACKPERIDSLLKRAVAPCRTYSTSGLRVLSNSDDPNFIVKFTKIDSSNGEGSYIFSASLSPMNNGHIVEGKTRDSFDWIAYTFCFDRLGQLRGYKRADPTE